MHKKGKDSAGSAHGCQFGVEDDAAQHLLGLVLLNSDNRNVSMHGAKSICESTACQLAVHSHAMLLIAFRTGSFSRWRWLTGYRASSLAGWVLVAGWLAGLG